MLNSGWRMAEGGEEGVSVFQSAGASVSRSEEDGGRRSTGGEAGDGSPQRPNDRDQRPEDADRRKVIVLSVVPVAEWVERAVERNLVVAEVNERLAAAAPGNGFVFVDLDPVLADGRGYLRSDMTSDGVHLGARGYAAVLELLRPRINDAG